MSTQSWFRSGRKVSSCNHPFSELLTLARDLTNPFSGHGAGMDQRRPGQIEAGSFLNRSVLWTAVLLVVFTATAILVFSLVPAGAETVIPASTVILGLVAGLHGASYGAYKDSPFESFLPRRFVRELVFASIVALALAAFHLADGESPFVLFVSMFAVTRIISEFWKLFVRIEPQEDYRIPTQFHCVTGVVHHPLLRLLAGAGFLGAIYGAYCLFKLLPDNLPPAATGVVVGGGFGVVEAIAGAYKDGSMEGFYFRKFLKSPTFGAIGGLIASWQTHSVIFLLLTAYGCCRMFLELFYKITRRDYSPGKFSSTIPSFPAWTMRRKYFLVPYASTWLLYVAMLLR